MKQCWGVVVILSLLCAVPVCAQSQCDYVLSFENVSFSGTQVEDGYFQSGFSDYGYYLDICGIITGNTTDSIYAELSDDSSVYWFVYGTIIWNQSITRATIQASYLDEVYSTYLDGTIAFSRGGYKITAKGGDNDSVSYITLFKSIKGKGYFADDTAASPDHEVRTKFKGLDSSRLYGLKKNLQIQPLGLAPFVSENNLQK